ncbi:Pseudaminic acid biosynthesis-associated methyltransferase [Candidatus Omnitrophus magneticus]|uniref:Pseudaminic acid biosynthesis-associated methyltransferase n=1 Tax=Candidatus Omnitrophus magneticus TaxID=1609969 RepID=A0A0F0CWY0_9BACT|nr:Pseudaminic acid biosynthesis-associated methyltransferase [Candidatus Omnitrophus magneticus]
MFVMTKQENIWQGDFGKKYSIRNNFTPAELDKLYVKTFGFSASKITKSFLGNMNKNIKIIEVGSNVGNQLLLLQKLGFKNLYGIEINEYAVENAKTRSHGINIIQGSAFDMPFKDGYFDVVFTAGVLIHIHPKDVKKVLSEIYRCSGKYIWGYEYYSPVCEEISYRNNKSIMWKADYQSIYMNNFPDLKLVKNEFMKYIDNDNVDVMFLLKKIGDPKKCQY